MGGARQTGRAEDPVRPRSAGCPSLRSRPNAQNARPERDRPVNDGLWAMTTCPCGSIMGPDARLGCGMRTVGEAVPVWGQRLYGKSPCFPVNFTANLKVL